MEQPAAWFDSAAAAYGARVSYLPAFFRNLAERLALKSPLRLLDLGAGPGSVAVGLSPYCGQCLLVDISPEMLSSARRQPFAEGCQVSFHCGRAEELALECAPFDLVTIGRALHWLERMPTLTMLRRLTRPGSYTVVCWAGTYNDELNPWSRGFRAVRQKLRVGPGRDSNIDPRRFFVGSEFAPFDTIRLTASQLVSVDELVQRLFSYSSASPAQIGDRVGDLETELRQHLASYAKDGIVAEVIHNSAEVFVRQ